MSCFLFLNDEVQQNAKVNIDELYEKKKNRDLKLLKVFETILGKIQKQIQYESKKTENFFIWYQVPEYIWGQPLYDKGHCIAYIIAKLQENGFETKYLHPNTLYISWENWVPSYIRQEVKKKTGVVIDERGNVLSVEEKEGTNSKLIGNQESSSSSTDPNSNNEKRRIFNSVREYKPTGKVVYTHELFDKIEKKLS